MKLRGRVIGLVAFVLLLALVGSLGIVRMNLKKDILTRVDESLSRAEASFTSREEQSFTLLSTLVRTLEVNPSLRLVLNRTDQATLKMFIADIQAESEVDLILITDLQGRPLVSDLLGSEPQQFESIKEALDGVESPDYWLMDNTLYQVYSVPLISGEHVDGTITMGNQVDRRFAQLLASEMGVELLFLKNKKLLLSTLDLAPDWALPADLNEDFEIDGKSYQGRSLDPRGDAQVEIVFLTNISSYKALIKDTTTELGLLGGLIFLLSLALSIPVIGRVVVGSELINSVFETVDDGLCQLDREGKVILVNPGAERLLGVEKEKLIGQPFSQLTKLHPPLPDLGTSVRLDDATLTTDFADFPASVASTPFRSETGQEGAVLSFRDITKLKENERKLEQLAESKAEFLAHMSHEIRTPLNGVLGMNELLLTTPLNETQARYAGIVERSGRALLNIINDILDFSKLEAGEYRLENLRFSPAEVAEDVVSLLTPQAHKKGISISCTTSPDLPQSVLGDPGRLRQILMNLVGNAVKFTSQGRVDLRLEFEANGPWLVVEVEDTGIGIDPKAQKALFQPFAQAKESTSRVYGGTGLGLSISKKLISLMDGHIEVDSEMGRGSTFRVRIPATGCSDSKPPESNQTFTARTPESNELPSTGQSILVIDDNEVNREVAAACLEQLGFQADTLSSGVEASRLSALPYAAVLMDCHMPEMNGFETTHALREKGYQGPIIALTAGVIEEQESRIEESGMNALVLKPVSLKQLQAVLAAQVADYQPCEPLQSKRSEGVLSEEKFDFLRSLKKDDPDFLPNLLTGYLERLDKALQELTQLAPEGQKALAHQQKGAASNLGFEALTRAAEQLEKEQSEATVANFLARASEIRDALKERQKQETP